MQPNASRFRLYTERSIQSDAVAQARVMNLCGVIQFATCTAMCRDVHYHMYVVAEHMYFLISISLLYNMNIHIR